MKELPMIKGLVHAEIKVGREHPYVLLAHGLQVGEMVSVLLSMRPEAGGPLRDVGLLFLTPDEAQALSEDSLFEWFEGEDETKRSGETPAAAGDGHPKGQE